MASEGAIAVADNREQRTEAQVIESLSPDARMLLRRVLEIERARLHVTAAEASVVDEILTAVKGIVP